MDHSGKNLVFSQGLENKMITTYIKDMPFDIAMDNLAFANNLFVEKTADNFYMFENGTIGGSTDSNNPNINRQRPIRNRKSNFFFKVIDAESKLVEVDFSNTPIEAIINDIGNELKIDIFTTPLSEAGLASFKARRITFDDLLVKLFESSQTSKNSNATNPNSQIQNRNGSSSNTVKTFTFKKEGEIYFFGTSNQLSVRKVEIIHLMHRSVELLSNPSGGSARSTNRNFNNSRFNTYGNNSGGQFDNFGTNRNGLQNNSSRNRQQLNTTNNSSFSSNNKSETLISILPDNLKQGLDIKIDYELISFYVSGPSTKIERFKKFVKQIDKPVPVILIEVMIIEANKSATIEAGVSFGLGNEPVNNEGQLFPITDLTLGATTINKIIGGFNDFGTFNIGKVVPNFYATIKAMETNGDLKIRSTPKLATLNGHRATFSNGQTSYYKVTQRNIYGTDNPQTSEITNYLPIDAELGLTIKPLVSGNGQITLDIYVIQSSFGGRISEDAPPDLNSREFSSIIRVHDQDIVVLGGLEAQSKSHSGSGVPFLSKIPVIKWLFSSRKRETKKAKLIVLIKSTVFY